MHEIQNRLHSLDPLKINYSLRTKGDWPRRFAVVNPEKYKRNDKSFGDITCEIVTNFISCSSRRAILQMKLVCSFAEESFSW